MMKVKKIFWLYLFLLLIDMAVIFVFSGQSGKSSTQISQGIASNVIEHTVGAKEIERDARRQLADVELAVRKTAHIALFFLLGATVFLTLTASGCTHNRWYIFISSLVLCILYSLADEYHQTFVIGRNGTFFDVLIDVVGSLAGIGCVWFANKRLSFGIK